MAENSIEAGPAEAVEEVLQVNPEGIEISEECPTEKLPLVARVSSLLFVSGKPLTSEQIAEAAGASLGDVEGAIDELFSCFSEDVHGFFLQEVNGGFCLRTSPRAASTIKRLVPARAKKLSRAAAETLAVIAYKQPVQRAEIEAIRGVDALPTLKTLLDAKLVRIVGKEASIGHPALYGTTKTFLEKFGLKDLTELPSVRDLQAIEEDPGEADEAEYQGEAGEADPEEEEGFNSEEELDSIADDISPAA